MGLLCGFGVLPWTVVIHFFWSLHLRWPPFLTPTCDWLYNHSQTNFLFLLEFVGVTLVNKSQTNFCKTCFWPHHFSAQKLSIAPCFYKTKPQTATWHSGPNSTPLPPQAHQLWLEKFSPSLSWVFMVLFPSWFLCYGCLWSCLISPPGRTSLKEWVLAQKAESKLGLSKYIILDSCL